MGKRQLEVLLIGHHSQGDSGLSHRLAKQACRCRFVFSFPELFRLLENRTFDLLLGPVRLGGKSLFPLIHGLEGSATTLFYFQPVETSCWWLPALYFGRNCFGAPALRPAEFAVVLDETIEMIRSGAREASETNLVFAPVIAGSSAFLSLSLKVVLAAMPGMAGNPSLAASKSAG